MFVGCPGFVLLLIGKCSYGNIGKGHDLETLLAEVRHLRSSHEDLQARQDVLEARVASRAGNFLDRSENGGIVEPFRAP